jgi:cell division protein FtsB
MPEDKKVKSDDVKDAMAQSEHSMSLPKRDKSKKVWVILFVITLLALIGLGAYGYIKVQNDNKKIKDQQAQIDDLTNKKKTLEDAAAATATAVTKNMSSSQATTDEALITQAKNKILSNLTNKTANVNITERNGDFVRVAYSTSDLPGGGSSMTFKKVNGTWQFIYAGQLNPCTDLIALYGVPEAWVDKTCSVTPKGPYTPL